MTAATAAARPQAPSRVPGRRPGLPVILATVVAVLLAVGLLGVTGQLAAVRDGLDDPGALVRWGLPAARAVHDLAAALSIGLLVLGAWFVAPEPGTRTDVLNGARRWLARTATLTAAVWLVAGVAVIVLTTADVSGFKVGAPGFGAVMFSFVSQIELGRSLGVSVLLVGVACCIAGLSLRVSSLSWAAVAALLALLPLALGGHAAGSRDHMNAVDSLAIHLVAVCLWVGGLAALVLVARRLGDQLPVVAARYSALAGWCFGLVAFSGVVNAALRLGTLSGLTTGYGLLVLGKAVALGLLGLAGFAHRRATLPALAGRPGLFARLAAVEIVVMGAAIGLAVALSRSAPPAATEETDRVASLLGFPAPPPVTVGRYFAQFYPDVLWLTVAALAALLYLGGLARLRGRGDRWPLQRTAFWLLGCVALTFVTSGGPGVYGRSRFSLHMIQHMSLMVLVPFFFVFGAPVTLAMRALRARTDGSLGPREVLLAVVHARALKVLGHPVVAAVLFIGSLTVFYYSPLFGLAMFTHTGHVLMTAHFLLTGYLYIWALVGIDPGPARPPYAFRLVLLLMTLGFHAFFGIALMASQTLLAPDWWHALGYSDDTALLTDQQTGGAIAWGAGDLPSLMLGLALMVGWVRSDRQTSRRLDRKADRDGDADLRRYNEQLAALSTPRVTSGPTASPTSTAPPSEPGG